MTIPQPLTTESNRTVITSIVMAGVLVVSLGLAYAVTVTRQKPWAIGYEDNVQVVPVTVGALHLQVPDQFESIDETTTSLNGFDALALFADQSAPGRTLRIGAITETRPRPPLAALNGMLNTLLSTQALQNIKQWQPVINFRVGTFFGAWYAGLHRATDGEYLHLMAVLTEDARRYWIIQLSHTIGEPSLVLEAMKVNSRLIRLITGSASGRYLQEATPVDFQAAGFPQADPPASKTPAHWLPPGLWARVTADNVGQEPILLALNDDQPYLHTLRMRCVIDMERSANSDPPNSPDPLSPKTRLTQLFKDAAGRPPRPDELWTGHLDDIPLWRISHTNAPGTLIRQTWYAGTGNGRGLLFEILSEPQALAHASKWIKPLVTAFREHTTALSESDPTAQAAIDRGRALAQYQLKTLPQRLTPGWGYYITRKNGLPIGCQIDRVMPINPSDPEVRRGFAELIRRVGTRDIQIHQQWQTDLGNNEFSILSRWVTHHTQTGKEFTSIEKLQLRDHQLTAYTTRPQGEDLTWSVGVPEGFIWPMAEDIWPPDTSGIREPTEALVWMTHTRGPPRPYWVQTPTRRPSHGSPITGETPTLLLIRPMMSLDSDLLAIDRQGKAVRYLSKQFTNSSGGATLETQKIDPNELIQIFPKLEPMLRQWQQDDKTP